MKRGIVLIFLCLFLLLNLQPAQGAPKDAVVIAQGIDATTLDPHMRWDTAAINILMNIYDFLLTRGPDPRSSLSWPLPTGSSMTPPGS